MAWVSALTTIQSGNGYIDSVQYMVARGSTLGAGWRYSWASRDSRWSEFAPHHRRKLGWPLPHARGSMKRRVMKQQQQKRLYLARRRPPPCRLIFPNITASSNLSHRPRAHAHTSRLLHASHRSPQSD